MDVALADALLEKRIFMQPGANTTYVLYRLVRASASMELSIKALVNYCEEHCTTAAGNLHMDIARVDHGLRVTAFAGAVPFYLLSASATARPAHEWYRDLDLAAERARGLHDHTDLLFAGEFSAALAPGDSLTIVASTSAAPSINGEPLSPRAIGRWTLCWSVFSRETWGCAGGPAGNPATRPRCDQFIAAGRLRERQRRGPSWPGFPGLATGDATPWLRFLGFAWLLDGRGSPATSFERSRVLSARECCPIIFLAGVKNPVQHRRRSALVPGGRPRVF